MERMFSENSENVLFNLKFGNYSCKKRIIQTSMQAKYIIFVEISLSAVLQDQLRTFANEKAKIVLGEQTREKSKGRNHDLSVMAYKALKEANERDDRIEAYIKTQSDTRVDLEEKATKLERKAEIAEQVYEMACGSGGNEALREKLIDVMYENEQLKAENSKLRETLNKAYDFMKQFVVDGRNLLERFLESIGQVVEKVRDGFRR